MDKIIVIDDASKCTFSIFLLFVCGPQFRFPTKTILSIKHHFIPSNIDAPPRGWSYRLDWLNLLIATSVALSLPQVAPRTTLLDAECIRQCRSRSLDQSWRVHLDIVHSLPSQAIQHTPSMVKPRNRT